VIHVLWWLCWGAIGYGVAKLLYPWVEHFLWEADCVEENYQGRKTPVGAGLVLYLTGLAGCGVQWLYAQEGTMLRSMLPWLLFATSTAAFIGWVDDQHGEKAIKGFKGHFQAFFRQEKLTTGLLKAFVFTLASAVIASAFSHHFWSWILFTGLLVLSINTFNLLDVRPGRAVKAFLFAFVIGAFFSHRSSWEIAWLPYLGAVMAISRFELKTRCMLGDTGANLIGMLFGLWLIIQQNLWLTTIFFLLFAGLHVVAETSSISHVIERVRLLKWVDQWGRQN